MAEETESVRADAHKRQIDDREIIDWSGKRVILPRGTSLPASGLSGEVFVKEDAGGVDNLYIYDDSQSNWVTVGPA